MGQNLNPDIKLESLQAGRCLNPPRRSTHHSEIQSSLTTMTANLESLRQTYAKAGQEHVFTFYDKLSADDRQSLLKQLAGIDVERVNRVWRTAIKAEQEEKENAERMKHEPEAAKDSIQPLPKEAMASLVPTSGEDKASREQADKWRDIGVDAIKEGQVAVLLMAGGQGTRLGSSAPKGCYDIGLASHKSLFQLQGERIRKLERLASGGRIPWYVMTSGPTRKDTEKFFEENGFFGLNKEDVVFFDQGGLFVSRLSASAHLSVQRRASGAFKRR